VGVSGSNRQRGALRQKSEGLRGVGQGSNRGRVWDGTSKCEDGKRYKWGKALAIRQGETFGVRLRIIPPLQLPRTKKNTAWYLEPEVKRRETQELWSEGRGGEWKKDLCRGKTIVGRSNIRRWSLKQTSERKGRFKRR